MTGRSPRALRLALFSLGAAVLAGSCKDATQVTVQVTTDAVCDTATPGDRFVELGISVGAPGKVVAATPAGTSQSCKPLATMIGAGYGPNDLGTLVLAPAASKSEGVEVIAVATIARAQGNTVTLSQCETWVDSGMAATGYRNATDPDDGRPLMPCLVARRELSFSPSTKLDLPIQLDTQCTGVLCGSGQTCVAGACVSDAPARCSEANKNCSLGGSGGTTMTSTASGTKTTAASMTGTSSVSASASKSATATTGVTSAASTTQSASSSGSSMCNTTQCTNMCAPTPTDTCNPWSCTCTCDTQKCAAYCFKLSSTNGTCSNGTCVCAVASGSSSTGPCILCNSFNCSGPGEVCQSQCGPCTCDAAKCKTDCVNKGGIGGVCTPPSTCTCN